MADENRSALNSLVKNILQSSGSVEESAKELVKTNDDIVREDVNGVSNVLKPKDLANSYTGQQANVADSSTNKLDSVLGNVDDTVNNVLKSVGKLGLYSANADIFIRDLTNGFSSMFHKPSLREFAYALNTYNRIDKKFSLSKDYLFTIDIDFHHGCFHGLDDKKKEFFTFYIWFIRTYAYKILINSIELPNINIDKMERIENEFGVIPIPSGRIYNDENKFTFRILNTEANFLEGFLFEWMGYVASDRYFNSNIPFPKANIKITFYNDTRVTPTYAYIFEGAYPIGMETTNASHNPGDMKTTKDARFAFENMKLKYYSGPSLGLASAIGGAILSKIT